MNRALLTMFVAVVLTGCPGEEAPEPADRTVTETAAVETISEPAAKSDPQEKLVASGNAEISGVRAEVHELRKGSSDVLTLEFSVVNESKEDLDFGYTFTDSEHSVVDYGGIGGVYLVDPAGREKIAVMRGPDDRCICSRKIGMIPAGRRARLWAKFPAPAAEVERLSIMIPKFLPIDEVPLGMQASEEPEAQQGETVPVGARGEVPGRRVEITHLGRGSGDVIDLRIVLVNDGTEPVSFGYDFADPKHEVPDFGTVGGIYLLDSPNRELLGVMRDQANKCTCSQNLKEIGPGERMELWAKFPAPSEASDRLSVVIPHFMPVDDVPLN